MKTEKKILVIGGLGNMGKRYCTILDYLNVDYGIYDKKMFKTSLKKYKLYDGFIICTPTRTHFEIIKELRKYKKPILCEKPITKSVKEIAEILSWDDINLRMINQYEYFFKDETVDQVQVGRRQDHYNYFKTGEDGILWDCINVIGTNHCKDLWKKNDSPIWKCQIRGKTLNIADMDHAYIWNVKDWLEKDNDNIDYIRRIHAKIHSIQNLMPKRRVTL